MRRPTLLALTLALSFLGILDAWYLAQHALTNTALSCGIGVQALSGCNIVAQSSYSHFFGIPLGIYGLVFYSLVFVMAAAAYRSPSRFLMRLLFLFGAIGILFSIYFIYLQVHIIQAICIYCVGSCLLSLGIFALSLNLLRWREVPNPPLM